MCKHVKIARVDYSSAAEKYYTSKKFDPQFLKKVLDMAFCSYMRRFPVNPFIYEAILGKQ